MKTNVLLGIVAALCIASAHSAFAVSPTSGRDGRSPGAGGGEVRGRQRNDDHPAVFLVHVRRETFRGVVGNLGIEQAKRQLDAQRTEYTLILYRSQDRVGGAVRAVEYRDFPTVEWTWYFKNAGGKDTPILSDIQALDIRLERTAGPSTEQTEFRLRHNVGSPCAANDYQPLETVLAPGVTKADRGGWRTADQQRSIVLQPATGRQRRHDYCGGLARSMGRPIRARQGESLADSRGPGADALQAAARRGGPLAARGASVLEGEPRSRPEHLRALDDRP